MAPYIQSIPTISIMCETCNTINTETIITISGGHNLFEHLTHKHPLKLSFFYHRNSFLVAGNRSSPEKVRHTPEDEG
ncbi:hypothetical protein Hanom_Chr13g01189741 [Helianthus anomalus]